ncbi:MAG: hypothetical protein KF851_17300 [Pirellulaceae bacterium]|nr:hypothetical protein [Pirellulaceae bacterium]
MNLLGKILVAFILVMSICFMVLAVMVGASQRNWKQQAQTNKQVADTYRRTITDIKTRSTELETLIETEKVARQQQLQQLFSQLEVEKSNRDAAIKQLTEKIVENERLQQNVSTVQARLTQQEREVESLRDTNRNLVTDITAKRTEVIELTNLFNQTKQTLESLELRVMDMTSVVAKQEKVMRSAGLTVDSLTDHIPSKVDGVIVEVSRIRDAENIVVSLGVDDGIREGHTMDIFRGDRFIGKAVVVKSEHDRSILRVAPEYRQATVREGDHVTTRL